MQRFLTVLGVALGLSLACGEPGAAPLDLAPLDGGLTDAAPLDAGVEDAGDDMSAPDASMEDGGTGSAARILFVGNSYTFYNDLPELYATTTGLAPAPEVDEVTGGGRRLVQHAADPGVAERLAEGRDAVVLQEQSQIPGFPAGNSDRDASIEAALELAGAAGDARVVLYLTWGRQRGDDRNPALFPDFEAMQDRLDEGYAAMRDAIEGAGREATIAPVGDAFRRVRARDMALFDRLYASDGSHPSPLGSQLAALVFARTLNGVDLASVPRPESVPAPDWDVLVAAATAAQSP